MNCSIFSFSFSFFLFIDYLEMCMLLNMCAYLDKVGILLKFWCKNLGFLNIPMIPSIILVYHVIGYIRHLKCHLFKILSTLSKTSLLNFSQLLALHFSNPPSSSTYFDFITWTYVFVENRSLYLYTCFGSHDAYIVIFHPIKVMEVSQNVKLCNFFF